MIIIGDVHGNYDTLIALLDKIPKEEKAKGIVLCGDLIDRGPKSAEVVQLVIDNSDIIQSVRGNHEQFMIDDGPEDAAYLMTKGKFNIHVNQFGVFGSDWLLNGGKETMESYFVDDKTFDLDTFNEHIKWMESLPLYLEFKDVKNEKGEHLLVTHSSAGSVWKWSAERRKTNADQFAHHLMWGRPHNFKPIPNIYNVFGHTPVPNGPRLKSFYANVDTGCFYENKKYFKLTALQFPEMIVYTQECIDRPVYNIGD